MSFTLRTNCEPEPPSKATEAEEWFRRAATAYRLGRLEQAAKGFQKGLQLQPERWQAWSDLAKVLEHLGRLEEALSCAQRALALAPEHPTVLRRSRRIQEEKGLFDRLAAEHQAAKPDLTLPEPRLFEETSLSEEQRRALLYAAGVAQAEIHRRLAFRPFDVKIRITVSLSSSHVPTFPGPGEVWAAGWARPPREIGVHLPASEVHPGILVGLVRHELLHLWALPAAPLFPRWYHEAIAQTFSRPLMEWERQDLRNAVRAGQWIPLEQLDEALRSAERSTARLAYRQCGQLGETLLLRASWEGIQNTVQLGAELSFPEAFLKATGLPLRAFEEETVGRLMDC